MATINVPSSINWDAITGKTSTGNDTFAISAGARLTMDTDTRVCANSCVDFGPITIDSTTGGEVYIDGTKVRLIPYNTGSGNVPAIGTTISQGGVSAYFLGVWASLGVPNTASGSAMPASGYIKVKNKTGGNFASGALTGITATATGADTVGWIQIVGRMAQSCNLPFVGKFTVVGEWMEVGTTSGARNQTIQLPFYSNRAMYSGVWIETSAGSGVYEHYTNAILVIASTTPTTKARGQWVWIDATTGVCRIGHNGTNSVGYLPASGCKIRIPNVIADPDGSSTPYNFNISYFGNTSNTYTISGTGAVNIDKLVTSWFLYPGGGQPCSIKHVASALVIDIQSCSALTLEDIQLSWCNSSASSNAVGLTQLRVVDTATAPTTVSCIDVTAFYGFTAKPSIIFAGGTGSYTRVKVVNGLGSYESPNLGVLNSTTQGELVFTDCTVIGGALGEADSGFTAKLSFIRTKYAFSLAGTTTVLNFSYLITSGGTRIKNTVIVDGVEILEANTHPGAAIFGYSNLYNLDIRNIGSIGSPISGGTINPLPYFIKSLAPQSNGLLRIRRCYFTSLRTGLCTSGKLGVGAVVENVVGDYADSLRVGSFTRSIIKGCTGAFDKTATSGIFDNFFNDLFTSATTGGIGLAFNHQSIATVVEIKAGTPYFTGTGAVRLPTVGDQIEWTMPYYALGHTAFQNTSPVLTGGTASNFTLEYKIDKNDGQGFSANWATLSGANLSAETLDYTKGTKLKIRITTAVANSESLTFLEIPTVTTASAQQTLYPLEIYSLSITGLETGSDVVILAAGTETVRDAEEDITGTSFIYGYTDTTVESIDIAVYKPGFIPSFIRNYALTTSSASIPIKQMPDPSYLE